MTRLTAHAARRGGTASLAAVGAAVVLALTACGSSHPTGAVFNDQGQVAIGCMVHQQFKPTSQYRPGAGGDTEKLFGVLHYYTANGDKPYCDGHGPTSTDKAWLRLYLAGGADAGHISRYASQTSNR